MKHRIYFQFEPYPNSFLMCALLDPEVREQNCMDVENPCTRSDLLNSLSSISALYLYTGVPPLAHGTPAPKVAESVTRSYSYNHNKPEESVQILDNHFHIQRIHWLGSEQDFPIGKVHANYYPSTIHEMAKNLLVRHCESIDNIADKVIDYFMNTNADLLTKGRQTCCPLTYKSVPAATAFRTMYDFLKRETGMKIFSGLEWIQAFCTLLEKESVTGTTRAYLVTESHVYDPVTKQRVKKSNSRPIVQEKQFEQPSSQHYLLHIASYFESYLKSQERAHQKRRAIASPNMILRMFLAIIEEFHLELGKVTEGSTISIGGEAKKQKITAVLGAASLLSTPRPHILQATQDATKFNECMSASAFEVTNKTLFCPEVRQSLGLPPPRANGTLFSRISSIGNFLIAIKRINMGPGPIAYSECSYNRLRWMPDHIPRMNQFTQSWFRDCLPLLMGEGQLLASSGMLMGMCNGAASTQHELPHLLNMDPQEMIAVSLVSSDDGMTKFCASSVDKLRECIVKHRINLELIGINLSDKKTFYFPDKYGEYTSWYQDGDFVAQYGVETSSIRPQGSNPPDDFNSVAKGVMTALQTLNINPLGATMRLRLGVDGVRRAWKIETDVVRDNVGDNVLLLADGGIRPWHFANSHLEESSLREHFVTTQEEKEYLLRIRNPENPFNKDPTEDVTFSAEYGRLVTESIDTPRTAFHYCKRSNRTARNSDRKAVIEMEEANGSALQIIRSALPHTHYRTPTSSTAIGIAIQSALAMMSTEFELSPAEESLWAEVQDLLQFGSSARKLQNEADDEISDTEL
uniref:RNA-directed RNA polymerase catalytic subunit n=1 Tax=Lestrade virus TaxID=2600332 RepID=A0A5B8X9V8_9ORTO|nr:PB1 [Lestrade virus]